MLASGVFRLGERLVNSEAFKKWHKVECARRMGQPLVETPEEIEARIDKELSEGDTSRVEYYDPAEGG